MDKSNNIDGLVGSRIIHNCGSSRIHLSSCNVSCRYPDSFQLFRSRCTACSFPNRILDYVCPCNSAPASALLEVTPNCGAACPEVVGKNSCTYNDSGLFSHVLLLPLSSKLQRQPCSQHASFCFWHSLLVNGLRLPQLKRCILGHYGCQHARLYKVRKVSILPDSGADTDASYYDCCGSYGLAWCWSCHELRLANNKDGKRLLWLSPGSADCITLPSWLELSPADSRHNSNILCKRLCKLSRSRLRHS